MSKFPKIVVTIIHMLLVLICILLKVLQILNLRKIIYIFLYIYYNLMIKLANYVYIIIIMLTIYLSYNNTKIRFKLSMFQISKRSLPKK